MCLARRSAIDSKGTFSGAKLRTRGDISGKRMTMLPQKLAYQDNDEMDKEAWQCMESLDRWCKRRKALEETLRQGWMQLVSARYEMGSGRISEPLFSLRPQASQTVLETSTPEATDKGAPVVFDLVKTDSGREQASAEPNVKGPRDPSAKAEYGLRRRPISSSAEDLKDEVLEKRHSYGAQEREDKEKTLEVQKSSLQGFGAMASSAWLLHLEWSNDT